MHLKLGPINVIDDLPEKCLRPADAGFGNQKEDFLAIDNHISFEYTRNEAINQQLKAKHEQKRNTVA